MYLEPSNMKQEGLTDYNGEPKFGGKNKNIKKKIKDSIWNQIK